MEPQRSENYHPSPFGTEIIAKEKLWESKDSSQLLLTLATLADLDGAASADFAHRPGSAASFDPGLAGLKMGPGYAPSTDEMTRRPVRASLDFRRRHSVFVA